ncbi:agmatinase [Candidatus Methanosphaera massiliense]|uniref:agmatinase n=1 Tax=Candidatus Methanosphaera massiliense TaxID=3017187 RepID=UPI000DC20E9C|nr:agmatinase [Candidatus Methanosphaera massiliense]MDD6286657.1 agmatinase [Methanobacteriaceae archaeon]MDE4078370.1 agmatinase [Candidatus Methanosphaera massiliense]MDY2744541.1 agmatinase [Methanosphaera sp.]RAP44724.1 MAG: agmatinase [Methanosphaera sp. SHI1033]
MFFYADNMMRFAFSEQLDDNDYEPGYALMGIPFDSTTSYRAGSRYGPKAIREASYNFEAYNLRYDTSLSCYNYDIGDVQVNYGNYEETDYMIKDTVLSLIDMGLSPIAMGGEHTITAGVLGAIHDYDEEYFNDLTVIHFDAHFDMRDTYLGEIYSHASVLRRVHEMNPKEIIQLGIRSAEYDEYQYVKSQDNISYYTSQDIQDDKESVLGVLEKVKGPVYLTVDIDVLDPAYAPSVGTPAPCGLTPRDMEDFIEVLAPKETIGMDLVEVSSDTIGDSTSVNAAKIIYDFLCLQEF